MTSGTLGVVAGAHTTSHSVPILDIRSLSKTYPGQRALSDAALVVRPGEVHALIGQNGSGKSTLIKVIAGYVKADHGDDVLLNGERIDLWRPTTEQRARIRIVHQDLGLVPTLSAIENLALGRGFDTDQLGRIRWRREARRCQQLLLEFGLAPDVRQPVAMLTAAERSAIAIVRALQDWDFSTPGLLILDEPTASLNGGEVQALFREVRRLAQRGAGVIFVSHVLSEVLDLADSVSVLRDGHVVAANQPVAEHDSTSLVQLMVGREVVMSRATSSTTTGRHALEVDGVYGLTLRGVSLKVRAGEVLGIAGLVGSGRDEICSGVFGVTPRFAGRVLVNKRKVFAHPHESVRAGMALVPADRKRLGLIPSQRLEDHVPLPRLSPLRFGPFIRRRALRRDAAHWVDQLAVDPPLLQRRLEKFSGGNQQKAVLARWLRTEPVVLLLDEPTQGVDIGAKTAIYKTVDAFAANGGAVVVASPDAEELVRLCHRVLVLRGGMVACELSGKNLSTSRILQESLGATSLRTNSRIVERTYSFRVVAPSSESESNGDGTEMRTP
ncbi:MAG: sugar ABC transporter ATP-binding protein [Ilumatobacteraceae bacterium]